MNRRNFIAVSSVSAAGMRSSGGECFPLRRFSPERTNIGRYTLSELIGSYTYEISEDYFPFSNRHSVDHEYGGFMCNLNDDGTLINTGKRLWYLGRGIWVYSFLYNHIDQNPENAEIARKTVDFTLANVPFDSWSWPPNFSREGEPRGRDERISGVNFFAEGLNEFSKIKGNEHYWDTGKKLLLRMVDKYDHDPDYYNIWTSEDERYVKRARVLGHWMTLTHISSQMLEIRPDDKELKALSDRCIDSIINYHYNPEYRLTNEILNHDLSRPTNSHSRNCLIGHSVETFWMVMKEAVRRRDKALFELSAERFRFHMQVGWDNVYGGIFANLQDIETNTFSLDKICWPQEECLIGLLMIIEHTGAEWAYEWFDRLYTYTWDKFPKRRHGFKGWLVRADRQMTFASNGGRWENYHHPRHLMYNYLALERIASRKGRKSGVFG